MCAAGQKNTTGTQLHALLVSGGATMKFMDFQSYPFAQSICNHTSSLTKLAAVTPASRLQSTPSTHHQGCPNLHLMHMCQQPFIFNGKAAYQPGPFISSTICIEERRGSSCGVGNMPSLPCQKSREQKRPPKRSFIRVSRCGAEVAGGLVVENSRHTGYLYLWTR